VEFTDVRDLAAWIVAAVERRRTGAFNVSGKSTRGDLFEACMVPGADLVWAQPAWLEAHGVALWTDLPLCVDAPGFATRSTQKAIDAGLRFRPVAETVRDTRAWAGDRPLEAGLDPERERELLRAIA
jgi:2'-hydroxyisoflavone reductase